METTDNMQTKTCCICAEPIRIEAKKCPHCMSIQGKLAGFNYDVRIQIALVIVAFACLFWIIFKPSPDVAQYRNKIEFRNLQTYAEEKKDGEYVSCIGDISNKSPENWRDLLLEARFYNSNNILIDTFTSTNLKTYIRADEVIKIRIRDKADRPIKEYARCELYIQDAQNTRH